MKTFGGLHEFDSVGYSTEDVQDISDGLTHISTSLRSVFPRIYNVSLDCEMWQCNAPLQIQKT